ncbi:hypothetical protein SGLAM104S_08758 [Streptomyces glaucescens]
MSDAKDVRRIALSLRDATEKIAWSMPTFRVAGKMFATLPGGDLHGGALPKVERDELVLAGGEVIDRRARGPVRGCGYGSPRWRTRPSCGTSRRLLETGRTVPASGRHTPSWGCGHGVKTPWAHPAAVA